MRFSTALAVLSAAFATASATTLETRQTGYASCALPCLTAGNSTCNSSDTKCLCEDKQFVNQTTTCFEENCTGDDLTKSLEAAIDGCASVGVTLSSSAAGPTSTSNPSSTSSPAPSSSSGSNNNSAGFNSVNVLFALSALGLIGCAL